MKTNKIVIIIVCIVLSAVILMGLFLYFVFGIREKVSYDINMWDNMQVTHAYLPTVNEIGDYTDVEFKHLHKDMSILFQSDAYILKASFTTQEFEKQISHIESKYHFQETVTSDVDKKIENDTFFELDDFQFKLLSLDEYNLEYPKQMVFIGVSNKNKEIAYVYYFDMDLDYIDSSFQDFLKKECGWE